MAERIAVLTYHKYPGADWPGSDFTERTVTLANGEETKLSLAERSIVLSNGLAIREVRCRKDSGHLPETTRVVNPAWRQLDQAVRRERSRLMSLQARFVQLSLQGPLESTEVEAYTLKKGELQQECQRREQTLDTLKAQRKAAPRHVILKELPEEQRFQQLHTESKHFVDTIEIRRSELADSLSLRCLDKRSRTALIRFHPKESLPPDGRI